MSVQSTSERQTSSIMV